MKFSCPHCHAFLDIPEQYRGKAGRCSACGQVFQAPPVEEKKDEGIQFPRLEERRELQEPDPVSKHLIAALYSRKLGRINNLIKEDGKEKPDPSPYFFGCLGAFVIFFGLGMILEFIFGKAISNKIIIPILILLAGISLFAIADRVKKSRETRKDKSRIKAKKDWEDLTREIQQKYPFVLQSSNLSRSFKYSSVIHHLENDLLPALQREIAKDPALSARGEESGKILDETWDLGEKIKERDKCLKPSRLAIGFGCAGFFLGAFLAAFLIEVITGGDPGKGSLIIFIIFTSICGGALAGYFLSFNILKRILTGKAKRFEREISEKAGNLWKDHKQILSMILSQEDLLNSAVLEDLAETIMFMPQPQVSGPFRAGDSAASQTGPPGLALTEAQIAVLNKMIPPTEKSDGVLAFDGTPIREKLDRYLSTRRSSPREIGKFPKKLFQIEMSPEKGIPLLPRICVITGEPAEFMKSLLTFRWKMGMIIPGMGATWSFLRIPVFLPFSARGWVEYSKKRPYFWRLLEGGLLVASYIPLVPMDVAWLALCSFYFSWLFLLDFAGRRRRICVAHWQKQHDPKRHPEGSFSVSVSSEIFAREFKRLNPSARIERKSLHLP